MLFDSAVAGSGGNEYDVAWTFAKATGGRNTLRRTEVTYPNTDLIEYTYLSTPHDADASRVTRVKYETVVVAEYSYLGLAQLAGEDLAQADARWHTYDTTTGSTLYGDLDRFNRVIHSRWTGYRVSGTRDFYDLDIAYDRNSNITRTEDNVHTAGAAGSGNGLFDAMYSIDNVNRLTRTKEGHWDGSTITDGNATRDEQWTLTQTGNWSNYKRDLGGGIDWVDAGEYQDTETFNLANELTKRELDTNNSPGYETTYNRVHDKAGNLTDDGDDYKYEYDAFGRLRKVKNQSNVLVAEYTYNGLGQRIGWHYDVDADGTVESSADDPWFRFVYDDSWRVIAVYRDTTLSEHFVYHAAGLGAFGGSSYIDAVILRDRDTTGDGAPDQKHFYCQNWRGDVSAVLTATGKMVEWAKYSSYGVPFALPVGDTDSDGDWDATDSGLISDNTAAYDVRRDADLDGDADSADVTHANSIVSGYQTLGRGVLSSTGVSNRKGYAGYERDPTFHGAGRHLHHVRHRVYDADVGRWTHRDPQGYIDGMSLYAYVQGMAVIATDPMGLFGCRTQECVRQQRLAEHSRRTGSSRGPGGGGAGPDKCGGGTCSVPNPAGPSGGGIGPIVCSGSVCSLPYIGSSLPLGSLCQVGPGDDPSDDPTTGPLWGIACVVSCAQCVSDLAMMAWDCGTRNIVGCIYDFLQAGFTNLPGTCLFCLGCLGPVAPPPTGPATGEPDPGLNCNQQCHQLHRDWKKFCNRCGPLMKFQCNTDADLNLLDCKERCLNPKYPSWVPMRFTCNMCGTVRQLSCKVPDVCRKPEYNTGPRCKKRVEI